MFFLTAVSQCVLNVSKRCLKCNKVLEMYPFLDWSVIWGGEIELHITVVKSASPISFTEKHILPLLSSKSNYMKMNYK